MTDVIDTIIAEAGGEGDKGITAAVWSMVQRAAARGQTLDQVIKSGFDGYSNPGSGARKAQQNSALRNKVQGILDGVQNGTIPNPVPGADHFISGDKTPAWASKMKPVATIGGHRFYASGNVPQSAQGTALQAINSASPKSSAPQALMGYSPQQSSPRQAAPIPASMDERLLARTGIGGSRIAPEPAGIDDMMLARTGIGGSRLASPPVIPTSPTDAMVYNSKAAPPSNSYTQAAIQERADALAGRPVIGRSIIERDAPRTISAVPSSSPRVTGEGLNVRPVTTVKIGAEGQPVSTALESALARLQAAKSVYAQGGPTQPAPKPLSPAYNPLTSAQQAALSAVPAVSPYAAGNPLVDAANNAKQVASQRFPASASPTQKLDVGWNDPELKQVAMTTASVPLPRPRPSLVVADTQGLYGIPMSDNIPAQKAPGTAKPTALMNLPTVYNENGMGIIKNADGTQTSIGELPGIGNAIQRNPIVQGIKGTQGSLGRALMGSPVGVAVQGIGNARDAIANALINGNGGTVTQGKSGPLNSYTQQSTWWQQATGGKGSGSSDKVAQSISGGG